MEITLPAARLTNPFVSGQEKMERSFARFEDMWVLCTTWCLVRIPECSCRVPKVKRGFCFVCVELKERPKDTTVKLWSMKTRRLAEDLPGHEDEVFAVDWDPLGACAASGGKDRVLKIWKGAS
jgi:hypothetical protein